MITQYFDLNMIPDSEPVVVHVNQYDTGTGRLVATLYNGDTLYTPTGTAAIQGTKPDGRGFMYSATLSGNTVTADLKDQMSVVAGHVRCQIVISETSGNTGTFCFDLDVQESALPDDAEISESDYPIIEELIHEAQEAAATATQAETNAEASAEDSEAWAVGTRGGEPVSPSDPTYHNNSKYWAEHGGGGTGGHTIMDENGDDMPARNTLQFVNMDVTDDSTHGITVVTGSRGVLPYLYIDSEAGSTVTVVAPDSSVITPTAAGSGHWECEVPGYGVYVIHSVLDSEDATVSVTIDSVKEYHITDSHYEYTINITAQVGATVRVACGTEIYTGTGTGSPVAFVVHQASATYTLTATLDGVTDTQTVTSASTTGQSTSVTLHIFTATLNISTEAQELAGATITITKGGSTVGTASFPASGTLTVNYTVHETGSYTASVTYSGETYSDTQPVSTETTVNFVIVTIPNGSTATPTDDIQTWLKCAGIFDKTSYTTLSDVLSDPETLYILTGNNNAVDYLVRSTTWVSGITADEYAMKYIGKWNYASDTLLADSTWGSAIVSSTYASSVINAEVPIMTSDTQPKGVANLPNATSGNEAYKAFDGNDSTFARSSGGTASLSYMFTSPVMAKKAYILLYNDNGSSTTFTIDVKGSNDGEEWSSSLGSDSITIANTSSGSKTIDLTNASKYTYYEFVVSNTTGTNRIKTAQFYGRTDVTEGIDVYGAASDDMTVTGNGITLTISTDLSGHYIVPKTNLPNGTYTFTSIKAKDPTNLSNDYSKSVTVTDGTAEVYIMPDNTLYWWGYMDNLEVMTSALGYQTVGTDYTAFKAPTINPNSIRCSSTSNTESGMGSINSVHITQNVYAIAQGITVLNGSYGNTCRIAPAKNNRRNTPYANVTSAQIALYQLNNTPAEGDYNISFYSVNVRACDVYAFWYV